MYCFRKAEVAEKYTRVVQGVLREHTVITLTLRNNEKNKKRNKTQKTIHGG